MALKLIPFSPMNPADLLLPLLVLLPMRQMASMFCLENPRSLQSILSFPGEYEMDMIGVSIVYESSSAFWISSKRKCVDV